MSIYASSQRTSHRITNHCLGHPETLRSFGRLSKTGGNTAIVRQPLQVYVADDKLRISRQARRFLEDSPVLSHDNMPTEDDIIR